MELRRLDGRGGGTAADDRDSGADRLAERVAVLQLIGLNGEGVAEFVGPGGRDLARVVAVPNPMGFRLGRRPRLAVGVLDDDPSPLLELSREEDRVKDDAKGKDDVTAPLGEMHVPAEKPVIIYLTSKDVIHSFKVAPLRVTQDAIPGMVSVLHFVPTLPGKYMITCAQLCGSGHSTMKGLFTVDTKENFVKWMAEKSKSGGATSFE